jgi:PAS domain S-box-containing protein
MQRAKFRSSEAHIRAIIDSTPDAFVAVNLQGTVAAFNRAAETLFGLPASAMLGHPVAQSRLPEALRRCFAVSLRRASAGEPIAEKCLEIEGLRDGQQAFVAEASLFTAGTGKHAVLAARLHDITHRRQAEEKTKRLSRILKTMAEGNQALVRATSEDELFQAMCRVIVESGGYRMAWIGRVEHDEEKSVRPVAHAGHEAGYLALAKISWGDNPYGRGPSGMSIRTGTPQFNNDITDNPVMGPWRELALERGYLSSISLPLKDKAGVFGALTIYASEPRAFGPDEVALLVELAGDVSYGVTALRTRREHGEMEQTLRLIAERRQAEDALRESEERYRLLVEQSADGIFSADAHGRCTDINTAGCAMLGYARDEILGRSIADIIESDEIPRIEPETARLASGKAVRSEWRFRRKDGSAFVGEVLGRRLPDGRIQAFARDITARRRAEEATARLAAIVASSADAIMSKTLDGTVTSWNESATRLFGYSEEEMVGQSIRRLIPPDRQGEEEVILARIGAGEDIEHYETVRLHKDGHPIDVSVGVSPIRNAAGKVTAVSKIVRNITARKQAEAERSEREKRDRYFLGLEKRLRGAASAREAVSAACEALGRELGAAFAGVGELQPDGVHTIVESAWSASGDATPLLGRYHSIGAKRIAELLAGGATTVEDVLTDPRLAGDEGAQRVYREFGARSSIDVPLMRDGPPRAFLFIGGLSPRVWTDAEVALARETLDRAWQALERARAEEALRESEERLRHLGDSLPDSAVYRYAHGADGVPRFEYLSAGIEQLNGVRVEDVLRDAGVLIGQILPEYLPQLVEAGQRSAREMSDFKVEVPMRRPDGEVRWMRLQSRPHRLEDGSVRWDGVQTDITERRRAGQALRESEARLRAFMSATSDVVYRMSPDWTELRQLDGRGFIADTEQPSEAWLTEYIHPDDQAHVWQAIEKAIETKTVFDLEHRIKRTDGTLGWTHSRAIPLLDAKGEIVEWFGAASDITERKRHEEHIDMLMHEVNHRAKNMLAVVLAVARQTLATRPEDFIGRFGERIQAMSASQDLLVKNEWRGVDIEELVRSQIAHFKDLIGTRIALEGPPLFISASAAQTIGMALHELATNAGKYGALSNSDGRLEVGWNHECAEGEEETFAMSWREQGGPPVAAPAKRGFGSTVISRMAMESLDAKVDLDFAPEGLSWRLQCAAKEVIDRSSEV